MNATVVQDRLLEIRPLAPKLGAAITNVRLADGMSDELFRAIYQAFLRYQVLLFPPQDVPPGEQVAFARRFGVNVSSSAATKGSMRALGAKALKKRNGPESLT